MNYHSTLVVCAENFSHQLYAFPCANLNTNQMAFFSFGSCQGHSSPHHKKKKKTYLNYVFKSYSIFSTSGFTVHNGSHLSNVKIIYYMFSCKIECCFKLVFWFLDFEKIKIFNLSTMYYWYIVSSI